MNWVGAVAWVAAMKLRQLPGPQRLAIANHSAHGSILLDCQRATEQFVPEPIARWVRWSRFTYDALGLTFPNTAVPITHSHVGPFSNLQPYFYWSQSGDGGLGQSVFSFGAGSQGGNTADNFQYVLPMIPGKIPGTPAASGMGLQVNLGGQTVYDPIGIVTWLADANLAAPPTRLACRSASTQRFPQFAPPRTAR